MLEERTQPSMHTEDSASNYCRHRKIIESICYCFENLGIEPALAFVIEAIDLVDPAGLMVSPQQEKGCGVLHLQPHQQADAL